MPVATVVPTRVMAATPEVEAVRAVGTVRRRTPVATARTIVVKRSTAAIARSRQEDVVAVGANDLITTYTINGCPVPGTVIYKFLEFSIGWHTPAAAPVGRGCVICRVARNIAKIH